MIIWRAIIWRRSAALASALVLCSFLVAQEAQNVPTRAQLISKAARAYASKQYREAAQLYSAALEKGARSPAQAYNAACSYSQAGDTEHAFATLNRALQMGFHDVEQLRNDPDLISLHTDPRWQSLLRSAKQADRIYLSTHSDPGKARLIATDVDNFWRVYDKLPGASDPGMLLQSEYLDKGSPGLEDFTYARVGDGQRLWDMLQKNRNYYEFARPQMLRIVPDVEPQVRANFRELKRLYPDATFPNVYFVVGRMNSAGTFGYSGLLIGAEMYGRAPNMPESELSQWHRDVIKNVQAIPSIIAHESIHYQQRYDPDFLLGKCLKEGIADFLGELTSHGNISEPYYKYGYAHEEALWREFATALHTKDSKDWMYQGQSSDGRPPDLGYFMGYRIAQAYYERAANKKQAIREMLNIKDFDKFLADSGYADKFNSPEKAAANPE